MGKSNLIFRARVLDMCIMSCVIHTDGSCLKNPGGPGGWAFLLEEHGERALLVSGGNRSTTNNRMELQAVVEALIVSNCSCCTIYSDSQLTIKCAKGDWKRKSNMDLWSAFEDASVGKTIEWIWVKGHSGDLRNDIVDVAARQEAKNICK
jgi:ribonuclease HI